MEKYYIPLISFLIFLFSLYARVGRGGCLRSIRVRKWTKREEMWMKVFTSEEEIMEKDEENVSYSWNYYYEDLFHKENIDNRRLCINDEISEYVIDSIVYNIIRYNRLDKGIPRAERKPIIVYINSVGGNVTDGYGVIDAIMASETPVYTVNLAVCYSMGFLIFLAGEKRYAMPSSTYLCHDGSSVAFGSMGKVKDRMKFETEQMEEYTKRYVLSRTKISEKQYADNYRKEWYFYPTEAKELGVVTDIVGQDCTMDDIV